MTRVIAAKAPSPNHQSTISRTSFALEVFLAEAIQVQPLLMKFCRSVENSLFVRFENFTRLSLSTLPRTSTWGSLALRIYRSVYLLA